MDIRFVTAGGGDVVAVMASEGGELLEAGKALDTASDGRIAKAMKARELQRRRRAGRRCAGAGGRGFRARAGDRRRQG